MDDILELDSIYENLYEYYVNDYIIFEGILRRDYYEVSGILNENAVTNFFKTVWGKIKQAFIWLRDKIKEKIDTIMRDENKVKNISWFLNVASIGSLLGNWFNAVTQTVDPLKPYRITEPVVENSIDSELGRTLSL